jgi:hypothetical protein
MWEPIAKKLAFPYYTEIYTSNSGVNDLLYRTREAGIVLKKDRRVNTGFKYNPVFRRYGFLEFKDKKSVL